jgi:hypothetical protein
MTRRPCKIKNNLDSPPINVLIIHPFYFEGGPKNEKRQYNVSQDP